MTPNYICPCCGHKGALSTDTFEVILRVVAEDYHLSPHDVEWASHCPKRIAMQARNVAIYLLRMFCAATNKEINPLFHWDEHSSNATHKFVQAVELLDQDPRFRIRVDEIGEKCRGEFRKLSALHAISA